VAHVRCAVLISGRGSNLKSLIEACAAPDFPAEIVLVISNVPGAGGLAHAEAAKIPALTIDHKSFPSREAFEARVTEALTRSGVELVCLAGFMRLLTPSFVARWQGRLINIHPSLLPAYPGLDTHARAIADGAREAGCTVHHVVAEMDAGPIIVQARVPILPGDDPERLSARVLKEEHRIYPEALRIIAAEKARPLPGR